MVLQKAQDAVENLKDKPEDERKAVAGGIAISVVIILLIGWGFIFLKKVQRGGDINFENSIPEEFNFSGIQEAQRALEGGSSGLDELRAVREQLNQQYQPPPTFDSYQREEADQFGLPSGSN